MLPAGNRLWIALIGSLQWLLRRQAELCQQLPHCRDPELDPKFLFDQLARNLPRPQPEIETILARVLAV
jgi:hypothetical protein